MSKMLYGFQAGFLLLMVVLFFSPGCEDRHDELTAGDVVSAARIISEEHPVRYFKRDLLQAAMDSATDQVEEPAVEVTSDGQFKTELERLAAAHPEVDLPRLAIDGMVALVDDPHTVYYAESEPWIDGLLGPDLTDQSEGDHFDPIASQEDHNTWFHTAMIDGVGYIQVPPSMSTRSNRASGS